MASISTVKRKTKSRIRTVSPSQWDRLRLETILRGFRKKKILVVGDVGVDRYTHGLVERISPEAPVPIVFVEKESLKLGLAANVADNIQALQGEALLTGVVGTDRTADDFRRLLRAVRVKPAHLIEDQGRRTVLKERIVSDGQQLLRVDYENLKPVDGKIESKLLKVIRRLIGGVDAVILQDYAKGLIGKALAAEVFAIARKAGKLVAVDPHSKTPLETYRGASILTPNTKEAEALTGVRIADDESLLQAGRKILKITQARNVVITRGREGMAVFSSENSSVFIIPTYAREVYDVSGAGDTVISVLTLALSAGASVEEAVILGNLAAGVEVGKSGTATVSLDEIRMAMDFFQSLIHGEISPLMPMHVE